MRHIAPLSLALLLATSLSAVRAEPLVVSLPGQAALAPDVAVGPRGEIAVLWLAKESADSAAVKAAEADKAKHGHTHLSSMNLYVAVSRDGGASFAAPVRLNRDAGEVWGFAVSRPRIAYAPDGTLHVSFPANEMNATLGEPVLTTRYLRSRDGGTRFEAARRLSTLTDADLSTVIHGGFASVAAFGTLGVSPDGAVHLYWIDTREMKSAEDYGSLYGVVSRDGGATFSKDGNLGVKGLCPCCQVNVAFDAHSLAYLGSRQVTPEGIRESTVAVADPATGRFGPRASTGGAPWEIAGCPLKPTAVATGAGNRVYAAAHNGAEQPPAVMFSVSSDGGKQFGPATAVHPGAAVSDAPTIAVVPGAVLVAWHAKAGGARHVFHRLYDANGIALGEPLEIGSGDEVSQSPSAAARPDGRVQLVWQQGERVVTSALDAAPRPAAAAAAKVAPIAAVTAPELRERLDAAKGQLVVLNLWATWCTPCLREIPDLVEIGRELAERGVTLLGVAMDEPADLDSRVAPFHAKYFPRFPTVARAEADLDTLASVVDPAWNEVLPTTYLIGRDGRVVQRIQGAKDAGELRSLIESAL